MSPESCSIDQARQLVRLMVLPDWSTPQYQSSRTQGRPNVVRILAVWGACSRLHGPGWAPSVTIRYRSAKSRGLIRSGVTTKRLNWRGMETTGQRSEVTDRPAKRRRTAVGTQGYSLNIGAAIASCRAVSGMRHRAKERRLWPAGWKRNMASGKEGPDFLFPD